MLVIKVIFIFVFFYCICEDWDLILVSKEMMLFFIFNGVDVNVKNKEGKKAGEGNADSKMFMNKILEEQAVIPLNISIIIKYSKMNFVFIIF